MKNVIFAPIAAFLIAAPAAFVVFFIIPHAGFIVTFALGILIGIAATVISCWQLVKAALRDHSHR